MSMCVCVCVERKQEEVFSLQALLSSRLVVGRRMEIAVCRLQTTPGARRDEETGHESEMVMVMREQR